jgi:hypothetical protein
MAGPVFLEIVIAGLFGSVAATIVGCSLVLRLS